MKKPKLLEILLIIFLILIYKKQFKNIKNKKKLMIKENKKL